MLVSHQFLCHLVCITLPLAFSSWGALCQFVKPCFPPSSGRPWSLEMIWKLSFLHENINHHEQMSIYLCFTNNVFLESEKLKRSFPVSPRCPSLVQLSSLSLSLSVSLSLSLSLPLSLSLSLSLYVLT